MTAIFRAALVGLLLLPATFAGQSGTQSNPEPRPAQAEVPGLVASIPWNQRTIEHLYNRAGFGAQQGMIYRALGLSPEFIVDELLNGTRQVPPPEYSQGTIEDVQRGNNLPRQQQRRVKAVMSIDDRAQLSAYAGWWIDRMVRHDEPMRDRMTLLWHGLFATEHRLIKRSYDMIQQHQLLRNNALENYGDLLRGIVEDPAMLRYLDNNINRKGSPNENLARELLELFSLGEGHYTEGDIREVARALTGNSRDALGNYVFNEQDHDPGEKTIFGERGRFYSKDVVEILLKQSDCARYIAKRLITYFEGVAPDDLRLTEYAAFLQRGKYELRPFMRRLLLDPSFYRDEVLGTRVASPMDYLVGSIRRLSMEVSSEFVMIAARELGQHLFNPPSVKGWDEGEAWINTGSLLARGNTAGLMLGTVEVASLRPAKRPQPGAKDRSDARAPAPSGDGESGMDQSDMNESGMNESGMESTNEGSMQSSGDEGMSGDSMGGKTRGAAQGNAPMVQVPHEITSVADSLGADYRPSLNLTHPFRSRGIVGDERIISGLMEFLLAIEPPADTHLRLLRRLRVERDIAQVTEEEFFANPDVSEPILRRIAHLILSLPEAQLL